jgi:hypothetical protein
VTRFIVIRKTNNIDKRSWWYLCLQG